MKIRVVENVDQPFLETALFLPAVSVNGIFSSYRFWRRPFFFLPFLETALFLFAVSGIGYFSSRRCWERRIEILHNSHVHMEGCDISEASC